MIKHFFKKIWAFLTHKWVKPFVFLIILGAVGVASFQSGSFATFNDLHQRNSFTTGEREKIAQSDITENLMSTEHGQKEYANIINAMAMKTSLKKDGQKIPESRLVDYSQYDVQSFKSKHPKATSDDFEANALTRYGSNETYEFRSTMDVARAMYAEKYYDYSSELKNRQELLKGMKSHHVDIIVTKDGKKSQKEVTNLTPYQYLNMFGEKELEQYKDIKKGDSFTIHQSNSDIKIMVKDNGSSFKASDVKNAMKKDTKFFLRKDIQQQMDQKIEKEVTKNDDLIKFNHPFDEETYKKGMSE